MLHCVYWHCTYGNLAHYDVHYVCRFSMNWTAFILLIATLVPTSCGNFTPSPRVGHKRRVLKAFSTAVDMMTTVVHCIIQYRPLLCTLTVTWPLNMRIPTYCLHTSSFPTRDSIITMVIRSNEMVTTNTQRINKRCYSVKFPVSKFLKL